MVYARKFFTMERIVNVFLQAFVLYTVLNLQVAKASDDRACYLADVGFVMDVSDTISDRNFMREKKIVQELSQAFGVKLGGSRAGLVTFSTTAKTVIEIGQYDTAADFNRVISGVTRAGGNSYINRALNEATDNLFGVQYHGPQQANRYLIILTDGRQTEDYRYRTVDLKSLTRSLRHFRVHIIAVGIGDHPHIGYLQQLVAIDQHKILVNTHANIDEKVKEIQNAACTKAPAFVKKCSKRIDLVFVLDASGSIGRKIYEKVKKFVADLLEHFSLSNTETHAGVIVYSTASKPVIKLNEFYDLKKFTKALSDRTPWPARGVKLNPPWMNELTRIDLALTMAYKDLFTVANGDRQDVPNTLIVLTDGEQKPPAQYSLDHYAQPLKNNKVTIFAVGFGRALKTELTKIASGPEFVLSYKGGVEVLQEAAGEIVQKLCNYCEIKVNLAFVLDASGTTKLKFKHEQTLVKHVAEGFVLKPGGSQAAVITFSDDAAIDIPFTSDLDYFNIEVDFLKSTRGHTFIDKGMLEAEKEFDESAAAGQPKILIVMTDGKQTGDPSKVKIVANDLRSKGFVIFAISTSAYSRTDMLRYIAGGDDNILPWKGNILDQLAPQVVKKACPSATLQGTKRDEEVDAFTTEENEPLFDVDYLLK